MRVEYLYDYDDFYEATKEETEEMIEKSTFFYSRISDYLDARWKEEN